MPLFGVLEDCREIVPELFGDASPSRVNVFDRRVAIRRSLCHRSTATRPRLKSCRSFVPGPSETQPLSQCCVDLSRIVGAESADHFDDERLVDRVQPSLDD